METKAFGRQTARPPVWLSGCLWLARFFGQKPTVSEHRLHAWTALNDRGKHHPNHLNRFRNRENCTKVCFSIPLLWRCILTWLLTMAASSLRSSSSSSSGALQLNKYWEVEGEKGVGWLEEKAAPNGTDVRKFTAHSPARAFLPFLSRARARRPPPDGQNRN